MLNFVNFASRRRSARRRSGDSLIGSDPELLLLLSQSSKDKIEISMFAS